MPRARHAYGVPIAWQSQPRRNVTGVLFRSPFAVRRNFERREPHPLRIRRAIAVPIKPWVVHQNGESAADKEHQKKEVHKMSQSQPSGETMRSWRIFQIDRRQESFRWKSGDQILSPGNCHWSQSDNGKGKKKPGIDPNTKPAIRWIVDSSMDFVECLHEEKGLCESAPLKANEFLKPTGGMRNGQYDRRISDPGILLLLLQISALDNADLIATPRMESRHQFHAVALHACPSRSINLSAAWGPQVPAA